MYMHSKEGVIAFLSNYAIDNNYLLNIKEKSKCCDILIKVKSKRYDVMCDLLDKLKHMNIIMSNKGSSIGKLVLYLNAYHFNIFIKPYNYNSGLQNEKDFYNIMSKHLNKTVIFESNNNKVEYKNIVDVKFVKFNKHIRQKADILLIDKNNNTIPISLKSDGHTQWESSDTLLKPYVKTCINKIINKYDINTFEGKKLKYDIKVNLDENIKINNHEIKSKYFVFGDDIENNGCIAVQTYDKKDAYEYSDKTIVFHSTEVFNDWNQIKYNEKYKPYIVIRKDKTRNTNDNIIAGLRSLVTTQHRIKNAKTIDELCDMNLGEFYNG